MNQVDNKKQLAKELKETRDLYTRKNLEYKKEKCKLLLNTNFEEELGKSRPTVGEKEAFVDLKTLDLRLEKELLYNKIKEIELEIEICTDIINL